MKSFRIIVVIVFATVSASMLRAQNGGGEKDNEPRPTMGLIRDVGISADGKYAFAGDSNGTIWVWDVAKRKLVRAIRDQSFNRNTIPSYAFSADGKLAVVGNKQGFQASGPTRLDPETLALWDLQAGKRLRPFSLRNEPVYAVALSPDGSRALSVSHFKTIRGKPTPRDESGEPVYFYALRLWNTSNGNVVRKLIDDGVVGPIAFSTDGKHFADAWLDPKPTFGDPRTWAFGTWNTNTGQVLGAKEMTPTLLDFKCIALSPNGKFVAVGHWSSVSLWNVCTGKLVWHHNMSIIEKGAVVTLRRVGSVAFSRDGKRLIAVGPGPERVADIRGNQAHQAFLLDATTGSRVPEFTGTTENITSNVVFAPDDRTFLAATVRGVSLWNAKTGKEMFLLGN